jgi:hypothetical protein
LFVPPCFFVPLPRVAFLDRPRMPCDRPENERTRRTVTMVMEKHRGARGSLSSSCSGPLKKTNSVL